MRFLVSMFQKFSTVNLWRFICLAFVFSLTACGGDPIVEEEPTVEEQRAFITTWFVEENETLTINANNAYSYNYTVDWGDDSTDTKLTASASHEYTQAGTYTVSITGDFPHFLLADAKEQIRTVEQWGDIKWRSMNSSFKGATNLAILANDSPDLSQVTDMSFMFMLTDDFNQNIDHWDVSNVTDMRFMFSNAVMFNQDITAWDVSAVTNMKGMFSSAIAFDQKIGFWDVSSVTDMDSMFLYATAFNQYVGHWDVTNVNTMERMFNGATTFNQNIGYWETGNVENMSHMLAGAIAFDQDISGWELSSLTNMTGLLTDVTLSTKNYDDLLIEWSSQELSSELLEFDGGNSQYSSAAQSARDILTDQYGIAITDGGLVGSSVADIE